MNIPIIAQKYLDEVTRAKYNKDFVILSKKNPDLLLKIITPIVMLFNKKFNTGFITILFGKMYGSGGWHVFCSWLPFPLHSECGLSYELTELIYYLERRYTNTTTYNLASKRSISPRTLLVQTIISLGHSRVTFLRC